MIGCSRESSRRRRDVPALRLGIPKESTLRSLGIAGQIAELET